MMPEFLALVHIRDMNFNHRARQRPNTILQSDARVGVSARIQHDAIILEAYFLHLIDQFAFDVTLVEIKLNACKLLA